MRNENYYYHITTIGCQMNKSDSERIAAYLEDLGFKPASKREKAKVKIIASCGVRQAAEDRLYGLVPALRKESPGAVIIISGCLAEREDVIKRLAGQVDVWLPVRSLPALKDRLAGFGFLPDRAKAVPPSRGINDYLAINPKHSSRVSAFVPIGNGCDNFCAYCVVPYARGRESYRGPEEIRGEAETLVNSGYKEIILIAQNVNSYRFQIPDHRSEILNKPQAINFKNCFDFPDLLRLVDSIPGDFWIRFATSHPKDMSDELIRTVAECDKVCDHIHLPAQSGDNKILDKMNRGYTREDYLRLIEKIRDKIPLVSVTTDIIVGFPGETGEQFDNTKKLFAAVKFDMAYIAQYSPRPGTAAAKLEDDVPPAEKKRRARELTRLLKAGALANNRQYLGKTLKVLVKGQRRTGEHWGETNSGKKVLIKAGKTRLENGVFVDIKIEAARDFGLAGTPG